MMASDTGLRLIEVEAGDPLLDASVTRIRALQEWVNANATTKFRPLEKIGKRDSAEDKGGVMVGRDSVSSATRISLEAMAIRWPPTLAAYALLAAAASEFALLPTAFAMIRRVTTAFVQARKQ